MASRALDIVARLQLRADQFSSEAAQRFAELKANAQRVAPEVSRPLVSALADVQKMAANALQLPRTATGSLDLSREIQQLEASATASEQKAVAARELSTALLAASNAAGVEAEALRRDADAARIAEAAARQAAQADRQRIVALEAVQAELNQTASATRALTMVTDRQDVSLRRSGQSGIMVGQQLQDFFIQVQGGQNVLVAFSQQISQAGLALVNMDGKLGAVGTYLTSGWGTATLVALTLLTPFVSKLFEGSSALDKETQNLRENAEKATAAAHAKDAFAKTEVGLIDDVRELTEEIKRQNDALKTNAERMNIRAKNRLEGLQSSRSQITVELADRQSDLENARIAERAGATGAVVDAERRLAAVQERLKKVDQAIADANAALRRSQADLVGEAIDRRQDQVKAIEYKYNGDNGLITAKTREIAEKGVTDQLARQLAVLKEQYKAELKAAQDRESAARRAANDNRQTGRAVSLREAEQIVRGIGGVITSTTRTFAQQAQLYERYKSGNGPLAAKPGTSDHERGMAIDIAKTPGMSLAKIREAFAEAGVQIKQLLDEGTHFHVAWKKGTDAIKEQAVAARDAAKAQKELEGDFRSVVTAVDPAQAALEEYRRTLTDINALAAKGKISPDDQIQYTLDAQRKLAEAQERAQKARTEQIFGAGTIDAVTAAMDQKLAENHRQAMIDAGIAGADEFGERLRVTAGEALRFAVGSALDLLGVRIDGPLRQVLQPGGVKGQADATADAVKQALLTTGIKLDQRSVDQISSVLQGATYGQLGGSVFARITGGKDDKVASSIGGVLGNEAGKAVGKIITKEVGGQLGKALGGAAGPIGSILGGVLGGLVGGLFKKAPKASAGVSVDQYGAVQATTAVGNNSQARSGAATLAGAVAAGINQIADLLGAKVTGTTDVKIGTYKDMIRVNDHGGAIGGVKGSGAITFETEEAAISYAIADALKDGVLSGISQASLKILRSGQDLQKAIEKATMIESIPKNLKAALDPLGAAIDAVNEKWTKIVDALKEGGATAEQMAQAQQLYNIELQQAKTQTPAAAQTLRDFLDAIRGGSDSPYSLREQEKTVLGKLQPFLDDISAGRSIDQSKFTEAANAAIDVERQLHGSTKDFFDFLDIVQAATSKAIANVENVTPVKPPVASPFEQATADNTAKAAAAAQTQNEMTEDSNALLRTAVDLLRQIVASGGSFSDFVGQRRSF